MTNEPAISPVAWRDWSDQTLLASRAEGKPVLLALTATWCHWCHVMDHTSYSDPTVIGLINKKFIPVRVDVDQRPDLSARYNQGGFPSLAILDSGGAVIEGRVYVPPDDMVRLLERVSSSYQNGPSVAPPNVSAHDGPPQVREGAAAGLVIQRVEDLYDPLFGGFGDEPKQPPWEGIDLLLSLYRRNGEKRLRDMACRTLDGVLDGLFDHKDGGFFRYSVSRDWKVPHYEKMLVTNARSISSFLTAFQITGNPAYKNAALGALNYLLTTLRDPVTGLFWASQDAGEDYYRLPWTNRDSAAKPPIDATLYTGWNALAAGTLVHAFGVLGAPDYLKQAAQVLEMLWADFQDTSLGLTHIVRETKGQTRFLADHVHAMGAYLDLYQATGDGTHLQRADAVFEAIGRLFNASDGASGGGFYDVTRTETPMPGIMPVLENALLAEALIARATITEEERYLVAARAILDAFSGAVPGRSYLGPPGARRMEEDEERLFLPAASAWARAWNTMDSGPVRLVVVGESVHRTTKSLVKAALRARTPGWVVQVLDPRMEADLVGSFGFPADGTPAAYLCVGRQCLAPFHSPAEVRKWTRPGALASLAVPVDVA